MERASASESVDHRESDTELEEREGRRVLLSYQPCRPDGAVWSTNWRASIVMPCIGARSRLTCGVGLQVGLEFPSPSEGLLTPSKEDSRLADIASAIRPTIRHYEPPPTSTDRIIHLHPPELASPRATTLNPRHHHHHSRVQQVPCCERKACLFTILGQLTADPKKMCQKNRAKEVKLK
jgi:hypothetical protein